MAQYTPHTWSAGDTITAAQLNAIEQAAAAAAVKADADAAYDAKGAATAAQSAATAAAATDATTKANAAQAVAVQRANHSGTQSADTLTDGATNKAFLATERTKLTGIATGATANATDAQLRDRTTHTGVTPVAGLGSGTPAAGKYVDGGTGAWTTLPAPGGGGGGAPALTPTAAKTAAYTVAVGELAMMNVAGGATALTLPTTPADKAQIGYRAIGATTAFPLVVTAGGADTIGTAGATSATIPLADEVTVLQYDAANTRWLAVANVKTQTSLDARYEVRAPLTARGVWTATTAYAVNDLVIAQGGAWRCLIAHTSGASFVGLTGGSWERYVPLAPVGSSPLEAANTYRAGHSYLAGTGGTGSIGYAQRFARRVGSLTSQSNWSTGGNWAVDTLNQVVANAPQTTLATGYGVALVDTLYNDLAHLANVTVQPKVLAGFFNHLLAIVTYLRTMQGGGKAEDTAGTFTGTWTAVTGDATPAGASSGGTYKWTETQNDLWTTSGIAGPEITFFLKAYDSAVVSNPVGAQYQIYQNGAPGTILASGTTNDQMQQSTQANTVAKGIVPVRLTGLPTASTAYVVKKTDASGTRLGVDCAIVPSANPITIFLLKQTPLNASTGVPVFGQPFLDTMNGYIDTIAAMFPAGQVIVADPTPYFDPALCVSKADNIHPNDRGHDVYANWLAGMARALPYRAGQNLGV